MVRIKTTDDFCCELNINATSYNLKNIKCSQLNNDFEVKITSLDLTNSAKNGDLISNAIYLHNKNENAHNTLFKSLKDKNNLQDIEIGKKINQSDLASVAISGSYADLINSPSIPADTNDLTNSAGFITASSLPTKTSDLTNDSGFITDVSTKANVNADNFSSEGKAVIANMPMPSLVSTVLTLGATGSSYTAPANGWFNFNMEMSGANTYVWMQIGNFKTFQWCNSQTQEAGLFIPAKKGDVMYIYYNCNPYMESWNTGFRFYYAQGEI